MVDRTTQLKTMHYHTAVVSWLSLIAVSSTITVAPSAQAFPVGVRAPTRLSVPFKIQHKNSLSFPCCHHQRRSFRATRMKQVIQEDNVPPSTPAASKLQLLSPVFVTLLASSVGILPATRSIVLSTCGTLGSLQAALAVLMLAMGLTITPEELEASLQQPGVMVANILLCFGIMPVVAWVICQFFTIVPVLPTLGRSQRIGTILLGCVSGGQASNLFTLLAGGNVALSVVCTLSTTLLGVVATPILVGAWLGASVPVQLTSVLRSVATLVLAPLVTGLALGRILEPRQRIESQDGTTTEKQTILAKIRTQWCPKIGLLATMILVAGGASNAAVVGESSVRAVKTLATNISISILLPILGGVIALKVASSRFLVSKQRRGELPETSKRALVIEVLSKSPTLAHVLALRHFGVEAAAIPAISMVSLALVGALVASLWQYADPIG